MNVKTLTKPISLAIALVAAVLALAVCLVPAQKAYAANCPVCGSQVANYYDIDQIRALPASINVLNPLKAPTCTSGGHGVTACGNCGWSNEFDVAALGHRWVEQQTTATCTEAGKTTFKCSRCGATKTEAVEALGHDTPEEHVDATCLEPGKVGGVCTRCEEEVYEDLEDEPALGHDFAEETKEATCTEAGLITRTCNRCGEVETEELEALGHDWLEEWTVVKEATAFADGEESRQCTRCDQTETRPIPATVTGTTAGKVITAVVGVGALGGATVLVRRRFALKALAKGLKFEGLEVIEKSVMLALPGDEADEEFMATLKKRRNLAISAWEPEEATLPEAVADEEPDVTIMKVTGTLEEALAGIEEIRAQAEGAKVALIVPDEIIADVQNVATLQAATEAGTLFAYAPESNGGWAKMVKLVMPLYKDILSKADSWENIGTITDLLGIPAVSTLTGIMANEKRVEKVIKAAKESIDEGQLSLEDGVTIVKTLAGFAGLDAIKTAAELTEDAMDVKDAAERNEESAAHGGYVASYVASDVIDALL